MGSTAFDASFTRWFVEHRTATWTDVMRVITALGSSAVVIPLSVAVVVALLFRRRAYLALFVALAVGGAALLSVLAKDVIDRARPPVELHLQHTQSSSFPSGHATQAAATYLAVAVAVTVLSSSRRVRSVIWLAAAAVVLAVGASRVYLGVHWATDVLGGWVLGGSLVVGLTLAFGLRRPVRADDPEPVA